MHHNVICNVRTMNFDVIVVVNLNLHSQPWIYGAYINVICDDSITNYDLRMVHIFTICDVATINYYCTVVVHLNDHCDVKNHKWWLCNVADCVIHLRPHNHESWPHSDMCHIVHCDVTTIKYEITVVCIIRSSVSHKMNYDLTLVIYNNVHYDIIPEL